MRSGSHTRVLVAILTLSIGMIMMASLHSTRGRTHQALALEGWNPNSDSAGALLGHLSIGARHLMQDPQDPPPAAELVTGGQRWVYTGICISFVLFAGLMSGLTLGLLSLDLRELEILSRVGKPRERRLAPRLIPVCKKHHWVLVTLLLCNACVLEALPIFLDRIVRTEVAIIISVTAVLCFGEIIPQALCSRFGLEIGANMAWFVTLLMWLSSPVSWPIAKFLDCVLGSNHVTFYRKAQLKEFITLHSQVGGGPLSIDEMVIMKGALDMREKTVTDAMVLLKHVYMLDIECTFDSELLDEIREQGYSRIPVFQESRKSIAGILLVKNLIGLNPRDEIPLSQVQLRQAPRLYADTPLYECLDMMQTGSSHMILVVQGKEGQGYAESIAVDVNGGDEADQPSKSSSSPNGCPLEDSEVIGIITLEDIVEELIGEEIVDETDLYEDITTKAKLLRSVSHTKTIGMHPSDWRKDLDDRDIRRIGRLSGVLHPKGSFSASGSDEQFMSSDSFFRVAKSSALGRKTPVIPADVSPASSSTPKRTKKDRVRFSSEGPALTEVGQSDMNVNSATDREPLLSRGTGGSYSSTVDSSRE